MFGIVYGECPHIFATEPWSQVRILSPRPMTNPFSNGLVFFLYTVTGCSAVTEGSEKTTEKQHNPPRPFRPLPLVASSGRVVIIHFSLFVRKRCMRPNYSNFLILGVILGYFLFLSVYLRDYFCGCCRANTSVRPYGFVVWF